MKDLRTFFCLAVLLLTLPMSLAARPSGPVILRVLIERDQNHHEEVMTYDRAALSQIAWRHITTASPFLKGDHQFSGVPLASLLQSLDITSGTIRAQALDGYSITIPVADAFDHEVLLALDHNGRPMRIRDRGPIWVIYPMTPSEALAGDAGGRMIWQLQSLDISR